MPNMVSDDGLKKAGKLSSRARSKAPKPTAAQKRWLANGLKQPGGKLPLFDELGREVPARTIRACIDAGWAEPWFSNPIKPDWLVCKLTDKGTKVVSAIGNREKS